MATLPLQHLTCVATVGGNCAVVSVVGELDLSTAPELARSIDEVLLAGPDHLVVDLAGVPFIDSSGLTVLARALRRQADHHGSLTLAQPSPCVRRVLDIVGFAGLVDAAIPPAA